MELGGCHVQDAQHSHGELVEWKTNVSMLCYTSIQVEKSLFKLLRSWETKLVEEQRRSDKTLSTIEGSKISTTSTRHFKEEEVLNLDSVV